MVCGLSGNRYTKMKSGTYKIIGRPGAGSLIAEFLLEELAVPYEIQFVNLGDKQIFKFESHHPQGRIPLLICPDGTTIFETLAIVNHITNRFNRMIPKNGTYQHDRFWQFLALFATSLYSGYHRQHHSRYYVTKDSYEDLCKRAQQEQATIYDYIETEISPFICGEMLTAADFYLYMLMRWDLKKNELYATRPNLKKLSDKLRSRESVRLVLQNQPAKI